MHLQDTINSRAKGQPEGIWNDSWVHGESGEGRYYRSQNVRQTYRSLAIWLRFRGTFWVLENESDLGSLFLTRAEKQGPGEKTWREVPKRGFLENTQKASFLNWDKVRLATNILIKPTQSSFFDLFFHSSKYSLNFQ
jgi:hypothetical protein